MKKVYFASGIENLKFEEVYSNYHKVNDILESHGFEVVNKDIKDHYIDRTYSSIEKVKNLIQNDLKQLKESDLLLVDYSIPNRNYVGATCEIVYACLWQKPVIVYTGQSNNDQRIWLRYHATYICKTLSEAIKYMVKNYS